MSITCMWIQVYNYSLLTSKVSTTDPSAWAKGFAIKVSQPILEEL